MTPRDWAFLGFRLLAIYLFIEALYWGAMLLLALTLLPLNWNSPEEAKTFALYGAAATFAKLLQAMGVGYWIWFDAGRASDPVGLCAAGRQEEPLAPLLVLAVCVWGATRMIPVMGEVYEALTWMKTELYELSELMELSWAPHTLRRLGVKVVVVGGALFAPRTIVRLLLCFAPSMKPDVTQTSATC